MRKSVSVSPEKKGRAEKKEEPPRLQNLEVYENSQQIDEHRYAQLNSTMRAALQEEEVAKESATHVLALYLGAVLGNGSISISSLKIQMLLDKQLTTPSLDATQKAKHDVTLLQCYLFLGDIPLAESHGQLVLESLSSGS